MARLISVIFGLLTVCVRALPPTVSLGCNQYAGEDTSDGITRWLGIRYAAPPLGELRFMPPADPPCVEAIQPATEHGKYCLATGDTTLLNTTSEDCLFLDVYAPTNATIDSKLPVFFFIQGGGFNTNGNPNYDGRGLVAASNYSIIVVTFNYRVGPYGFITDGAAIKANNGLRDQRKALEWVNQYISQFGGDPGHVVLGGASSGAASISLQMTAYGGEDTGLFHAAAAESVSFAMVLTVNESQYQYDNFALRLGCVGHSSLACLKNKTAAELQAQNHNVPYAGASSSPVYMWLPSIDNDYIMDYTYRLFAAGKFVKVPVIFGDDTNGGTIFTPRNTTTLAQSDEWLHNQYPRLTLEQLGKINELYPNPNLTCPNPGCYWRQLSNVYGEIRYVCPGLYISSAMTKYNVPQSWAYRFNVEDPTVFALGYGVTHISEVSAIFGPTNTNGFGPLSFFPGGVNAPVVPVIQGYWTSFIKSFNPNTYRYPGSASWQEWTDSGPTEQQRLLFNTGGQTLMETVDPKQMDRCQYFARIGVAIGQ
ncbi:Alpha/Beta hydrolase protein [Xylariales sp. AK1849]|nr:Alpha/Beta hydrolase protein [Xylariales sp. AK1849]